jgi:hypothetical protein
MYGNSALSGGAIYNTAFGGQSTLILTGASIHHNRALNGDGGGIYSAGLLAMTASAVDANSATRFGGGLFLTGGGQDGRSEIVESTISNNSALTGGGLSVYDNHEALLTDTRVRGNRASFAGGGMHNVFTRVRLRGGSVQANSAAIGGGLYSGEGNVSLDRITINNNSADEGGGVYGASTTLVVSDSTLYGNRAMTGDGGALVSRGPTGAILRNSTLSGNRAGRSGGAVRANSIATVTPLDLVNVTISGNAATQGGGLAVGGDAVATLKNTILAYSLPGGNCDGVIGSSAYSISSDNTCALVGPGDLNATDPMLMPLGDYGGPTRVHMLAMGSPAIDGVFGNDAPNADQRGTVRPQGLGYDIGAVERTATDPDEPPDLIFADGFEAEP